MASQKYAARSLSSHGCNCCSESLLVTFRTATLWWPVRSQLSEGKIAAEDGHPRSAERIRQYHEKRRVAVRPRAVRQDEAITARASRPVQEPSDGYFIRRSVQKISMVVHTHSLLQPLLRSILQLHDAGFSGDTRSSHKKACSRQVRNMVIWIIVMTPERCTPSAMRM